MSEKMMNEHMMSSQYFAALKENERIEVNKMLSETKISLNSARSTVSSKHQRNNLLIDEAFKATKAVTLILKKLFRLIDTQETAIQKCFQLIKENFASLNVKARRTKNKQSLQVHHMLESVHTVLSLQEFLLCALTLTSNKMQSMIKVDATNFSYILKHWWKNFSSSSNRLKIIIRKMKTINDQISYFLLINEMSKLLHLRSRLLKSQTLSLMKYAHSSWVTRLILNSTFRWDNSMIWYHNDINEKRQSY